MKTSNNTPSELIDHIGNIIRERQSKSLPTFYTISLEQFEKTTPVAEKEEGYENFKQQMLKYMSDYNLTAISVALFSGKSRNVKTPFQLYKIELKKQNPNTIVIGQSFKEEPAIQQLESSIPVHRYYDEKFDLQMRIMRTELEKQSLSERVTQLVEKYDEKLKAQEDKSHEKIKELEEEINSLQEDIRDFEKEIAKYEKDKHNSFGNIALGSIGARIAENFAKSDMGMGVLKGLLGETGFETLQGHLAGIETENKIQHSENETARIVPSPEAKSPREIALAYIQKIGEQLPDSYLRMLYDIVELVAKNPKDLEVIWNLAQEIQKQRNKANPNPQATTNDPETEEEEVEEDDETKIE